MIDHSLIFLFLISDLVAVVLFSVYLLHLHSLLHLFRWMRG